MSGELRRCPVHGALGVSRRGPPSNAVRGASMRVQPLARVDSSRHKNNNKKFLLTQLLARVFGAGVARRQLQCECRDAMIDSAHSRAHSFALSLALSPSCYLEGAKKLGF